MKSSGHSSQGSDITVALTLRTTAPADRGSSSVHGSSVLLLFKSLDVFTGAQQRKRNTPLRNHSSSSTLLNHVNESVEEFQHVNRW